MKDELHRLSIDESKAMLQRLARDLDRLFNGDAKGADRQIGFALFVFEVNKEEQAPEGRVNYVSNSRREDMLVAVREWLADAEGRRQSAPESKQ